VVSEDDDDGGGCFSLKSFYDLDIKFWNLAMWSCNFFGAAMWQYGGASFRGVLQRQSKWTQLSASYQ